MTNIQTGPSTKGLQRLAIPGVCVLIAFLGYFSQWLFNTARDLAPGPLTTKETYTFNSLLVYLWWTYYKACSVDAGRYTFPPGSSESPDSDPSATASKSNNSSSSSPSTPTPSSRTPRRWCKKCQRPKPLRAHHCRHCGRCIPKMDHHCPWTGNCVSMQTFPYFLRFLVYTNMALWYLGSLILQRMSGIWSDRALPAYLGPSLSTLILLTLISLVTLATSLALFILLFSTVRGWLLNSTMIEDWEKERHEAVLARHFDDSDFWGADGGAARSGPLERVEYPYDLGIFANMAQAMGTRNVLAWFWPFAGGPKIGPVTGKGPGWEWEENGFNDVPGMWPPPDPEKIRRAQQQARANNTTYGGDEGSFNEFESAEQRRDAFAKRQQDDFLRRRRGWAIPDENDTRSRILGELEEDEDLFAAPYESSSKPQGPNRDSNGDGSGDDYERIGPPAWTNRDGSTLWDYGVDENAEDEELDFPHHQGQRISPPSGDYTIEDDEDDVPIAELIRRRGWKIKNIYEQEE